MATPDQAPVIPHDPDFDPATTAGTATANATAPPRIGPLGSRKSILLLAASAFQLLVLAGIIGGTSLMFRNTKTVLLKVVPVDPRDMFRGEFVILSYDFSRVPAEGVAGIPGPYTNDNYSEWQGRPVFVPLIDDGDGKHFHAGPPASEPPPGGGPFLQGTLKEADQIEYGIEDYFVQEGNGKAYEEAAVSRKLWAEVGLTKYGWSTLEGLRIE